VKKKIMFKICIFVIFVFYLYVLFLNQTLLFMLIFAYCFVCNKIE